MQEGILSKSKLEQYLDYENYLYQNEDNSNYLNLKTNLKKYESEYIEKVVKKDNIIDQLSVTSSIYKPIKESKSMKRMKKQLESKNQLFGERELTQEEKNALVLLKLRKYLDKQNTMKSSDFKNIPKKFEMGTIIDEGEDFQQRVQKKIKAKSFVDQFLQADEINNSWTKKKFNQIQEEKIKKSKNKKHLKAKKIFKNIKKQKR